MSLRMRFAVVLGCLFVVSACGGGGSSSEAASSTSVEPVTTVESVEPVEPPVSLDFGGPETLPPTTDRGSLLEDYVPKEDQSEMVVELDSPNVATVGEETVFALDPPGECKKTPIGSDISAKQVIFDLYWNCLYRPIVVADDDVWLTALLEGPHDREYLRREGVGGSREASCVLGGLCDTSVIVKLGENVRAECSFESVVVPHERAGIRLQSVCGNDLQFVVEEK